MSSAVKRIRAADIDGRAKSPRYIQKQLADLHSCLVANATAIKSAIRGDSQYTPAETETEFYLAIDAVKQEYNTFDFDKALKDEYAVAKDENLPNRRVAAGIVYLIPALHTLVFSVVVPIAAAIAAGNCVVVELETSLSQTASLLRRILPSRLDHDTFAIVDTRPDESFLARCIMVDSRGSLPSKPSITTLTSPGFSRVIALIDRAADVELAAKHLVRARTAFCGRSPYAPDVVLVNEWIMEKFTAAAVAEFTKVLSASVGSANGHTNGYANGQANGSTTKAPRKPQNTALSKQELDEEGVTVVLAGDHGSVVSVSDRNSTIITRKFAEPVLIIHAITSLDDAVDFANNNPEPLLATYHFAAPAVAKYTSQFIISRAHFVNTVPLTLLLGPAAPTAYPTAASPRYTPSMFTIPCPVLNLSSVSSTTSTISTSTSFPTAFAESLLQSSTSSEQILSKLRSTAMAPLKSTGQREGKAVGFFDQGLMTGAGIVMTPIVAGAGVAAWYGVRAAVRYWR